MWWVGGEHQWAESQKKEVVPKESGADYSKDREQKCKAVEVKIKVAGSRYKKVSFAGTE